MLRVSEYRVLVDKVLSRYGIPGESLEVVPSVQDWCHQRGREERNPFRIARCCCKWDRKECHIVICDEITDDMIASAEYAMVYRGFVKDVELLDSELKFLVHTLLHEIACHVLGTTDQEPRDKWAFGEMHKHAT